MAIESAFAGVSDSESDSAKRTPTPVQDNDEKISELKNKIIEAERELAQRLAYKQKLEEKYKPIKDKVEAAEKRLKESKGTFEAWKLFEEVIKSTAEHAVKHLDPHGLGEMEELLGDALKTLFKCRINETSAEDVFR